jgi:hypothetical protein
MMRSRLGAVTLQPNTKQCLGGIMWWGIGFGGFFIYLVLLITLGVMTLRNGHMVLFIFGIFLPFLWIIGALLRPRPGMA